MGRGNCDQFVERVSHLKNRARRYAKAWLGPHHQRSLSARSVASANKSAYVAAKHGIIGLTKVVALENAKTFITCNAICPGWVDTLLVRKQIEARAAAQSISVDAAMQQLVGEKQPSERFVAPEHLAELALFLTTEAGGSITGSAYTMDGGWSAQ